MRLGGNLLSREQRSSQNLAFLTAGRCGAEVEGFGKGRTEQRRGCCVQSRLVRYICALIPALQGLCQIPVLSLWELGLGAVLRSKCRGGSCAALREAANLCKTPNAAALGEI